MARCDVCDLDLDAIERFCPGCGTPAPRRVAADVGTTLRESFHGAAGDDVESEYAFGTSRSRTAPAAVPPPPPPAPAPSPDEEGLVVDAVVEIVPGEAPVAEVGALAEEAPAQPIEEAAVVPYVVLPPRRAVGVRELPPAVEVVHEQEAAETPRRRGRAAALVLVVVLAAAGLIGVAFAARERDPVASPFTAEAADGSISLGAPTGWRVESRGPGVVGIGDALHDTHVHATAIRRSSLPKGLSLARRAKDVQREFAGSIDDAQTSAPDEIKVGPYPAVRRTLTTPTTTYVHTVVKMPKQFVNVIAWTTHARFDEQEATLLRVVGSLRSAR